MRNSKVHFASSFLLIPLPILSNVFIWFPCQWVTSHTIRLVHAESYFSLIVSSCHGKHNKLRASKSHSLEDLREIQVIAAFYMQCIAVYLRNVHFEWFRFGCLSIGRGKREMAWLNIWWLNWKAYRAVSRIEAVQWNALRFDSTYFCWYSVIIRGTSNSNRNRSLSPLCSVVVQTQSSGIKVCIWTCNESTAPSSCWLFSFLLWTNVAMLVSRDCAVSFLLFIRFACLLSPYVFLCISELSLPFSAPYSLELPLQFPSPRPYSTPDESI